MRTKRPLEVLRFAFVSPEFLIVLLVIGTLVFFPEILEKMGRQLKGSADVLKFVPTIPIILAAASIKYSWKLIRPLENASNILLYRWEGYTGLKDRTIASILICGIAAALSITLWLFSGTLEAGVWGALFLAAVGVPVATVLCQVLAAFKLREMLDSE